MGMCTHSPLRLFAASTGCPVSHRPLANTFVSSCLPLLSAPTLREHTQSLPLLRTPVAFCLSFMTGSAATPLSRDPHVSCSRSLRGEPLETPPPSLQLRSHYRSQSLAPLLFVIVRVFKCALERQKGERIIERKTISFQHHFTGDSLGTLWGFLLDQMMGSQVICVW